ncbi:MAG: DUF2909 domain-containing protein [Pseudomonadota bacterium]
MLKTAIIVLVIALLISLGSGLFFLMTDQGDKNKRRLFHSLGARLTLAIGLAGLIVYGVATGQLGHRNPWDAGPRPAAVETSTPPATQP